VSGGPLMVDVAHLQLGRQIAEGGFAEVVRGLLWGQRVAVKQLKADGAADETQLKRELEHETRLLAMLSHPAILTLIGYTPTPPQIVLEVLQGTAYDLVRGGLEQCEGGLLGPLLDLLSACAYLHARTPPLLHRDLKPPNLLHDERLRCKLCDFGTAIELPADHSAWPTECIGSALYLAPEIEAERPYGLAADVFSFGVLAYELYHLHQHGVDFYGEGDMFDGGGLLEGLDMVRTPLLESPQQMPERPESVDSDVVWDLLTRCLDATPDKRPGFAEVARSMGEARQSLLASTTTGQEAWL